MLNVNSPTVQMMLSKTPQGFGNMPVYYGNSPTVESTIQPVQQPAAPTVSPTTGPFPSPKEMLMHQGQANIYAPIGFGATPPRNIVGAYNPGYNAAFAGYSNPYMGYGTYGGYGFWYQPQFIAPPDEESRLLLEAAQSNGITYDEQLRNESTLYKTMSKIVSKNIGRDEDTRAECEKAFDIYCKYPTQDMYQHKQVKPLHVQIKVGDEVVADMDPEKMNIRQEDYVRNASIVEYMKVREAQNTAIRINRNNYLYDNALERQFDNVDLLDFFNNCAGVLMADSLNRVLQQQNMTRTGQLYDHDGFRKRLLENNGLRPKEEMKAVDRFLGRYGAMPDGRPTTPGLDPAVASSFSYNPKTGSYEVTAPNFIRDRLESARSAFIRSIDGN